MIAKVKAAIVEHAETLTSVFGVTVPRDLEELIRGSSTGALVGFFEGRKRRLKEVAKSHIGASAKDDLEPTTPEHNSLIITLCGELQRCASCVYGDTEGAKIAKQVDAIKAIVTADVCRRVTASLKAKLDVKKEANHFDVGANRKLGNFMTSLNSVAALDSGATIRFI